MLQSYKKQKLSIDVITLKFQNSFWGKIVKYSLNLLSNSNMILSFCNGKQFQFVMVNIPAQIPTKSLPAIIIS